ncbi:MAG: response regulator [Deltaproteobacteria bacterium]|nr:response regulator [Deltaproteobacteria bacterium]
MARVLIVDDTEILRRAMELVIRRMGHTPVSASSPRKALELALRDPPELALIDLLMPEMDGAELFRRLRAGLGERCPAVIFVSATPREDVARRVGAVGRPAGYVTKPFHVDDLTQLVADALAKRESGALALALATASV